MEDSKVQGKILALGKKIVKELELDPGADTLSKWLAHYLAEKIMLAEKLKGNKKAKAEKECFETILKLWEHRWSLPREKPFLQDFEPLFETLDKLNPNKDTLFFLPPELFFEINEEIKTSVSIEMNTESDDTQDKGINPQKYLDSVLRVDKLAKSLLADLLNRALTGLDLPVEREELIKNSIESLDYPEMRIIRIISDYNNYLESQKEETDKITKRISNLKSKICDFEELISILKSLTKSYQKELLEIEK